MPFDQFGNYEVRVGDAKIRVDAYDPKIVKIRTDGGLDAQLDSEGLVVEVHPSEEGLGYDGDCARARFLPLAVVLRAVAMFGKLDDIKNGVADE